MKLNNVIGIILSLLILSTFGCHFQNQMNMDADTTTIIVSVDGVNPDDISYITTCASWFFLCDIMFHTFSIFLFS